VRPSGTEPKVKCYLEVVRRVDGAGLALAREDADAALDRLAIAMRERLGSA
jgi:phosphomannomutase